MSADGEVVVAWIDDSKRLVARRVSSGRPWAIWGGWQGFRPDPDR